MIAENIAGSLIPFDCPFDYGRDAERGASDAAD
jgi:hypothetical protein